MKAIVGLGNPGKEYEKTRHNVGFMTLDRIAQVYKFESFTNDEKMEAEIAKGMIKSEKIILIKPQTFMNASGRAVQKIMSFYKIAADNLIVVHDDLDIMLGEYRLAFGSRSAGHKGVQSMIDFLNSKDFHRVRVGIKIEDRKIPTEKYVLGNFTKEEAETIDSVINILPEAIEKELV